MSPTGYKVEKIHPIEYAKSRQKKKIWDVEESNDQQEQEEAFPQDYFHLSKQTSNGYLDSYDSQIFNIVFAPPYTTKRIDSSLVEAASYCLFKIEFE